MARDLSLKVNLKALDNATKPMRSVLAGAQGLGRALRDTRDELKGLQARQKDVSSFRSLKSESERTGAALQANRDKIRQLSRELANTEAPTKALSKAFQTAVREGQTLKQKLGEQQRQLQSLRDELGQAGVAFQSLDGKLRGLNPSEGLAAYEKALRQQIDSANRSIEDQERRLKRLTIQQQRLAKARDAHARTQGLAGSMAAAGAGGVASGSGILYTGMRLIDPQLAAQQQGSRIAAQNGEAGKAGQYTGIVRRMRADGVSGDTAAIGEAVSATSSTLRALGKVSDAELERASRKALDLATVMGGDLAEQVQTVGILMKNGLAANSDQAFDLLTRGLQQVSTQMRGEMPEILHEYSTHFRNMGFSGQETMSLLVDMAKQGKYALDKTGDAIKEFSIRGSDMSKKSQEAYKTIGLDAQKMSDAIASGGPKAREALAKTAKGLLAIKSPADRANAAIALFGTPVEDLSIDQIPAFLKALAGGTDHLGRFEGAADQLGTTLRDNLSGDIARLSGAWSELGSSLMESQDGALRSLVQTITGLVTGMKSWAAEHPVLTGHIVKTALGLGLLMALGGGLTLVLGSILGPLAMVRYGMMLFGIRSLGLAGTLTSLARTALPLVAQGIQLVGRALLMNPIGLAVTAIAGGAFLIWQNWETLGPKFKAIWAEIQLAGTLTMDWFAGLPARFVQLGGDILRGLASGITGALGSVKEAVVGAGEGAIGWFKEKLGIHSPSRVFAELGGYTMAGLEQGIQTGQKNPFAALDQTAQGMAQKGQAIADANPFAALDGAAQAAPKLAGAGNPFAALDSAAKAAPKVASSGNPFAALDSAAKAAPKAASAGNPFAALGRQPPAVDNRPALAAARPATAPAAGGNTITITIHAAPGMDPEAIGRAVAAELDRRERSQQARTRSVLYDRE